MQKIVEHSGEMTGEQADAASERPATASGKQNKVTCALPERTGGEEGLKGGG